MSRPNTPAPPPAEKSQKIANSGSASQGRPADVAPSAEPSAPTIHAAQLAGSVQAAELSLAAQPAPAQAPVIVTTDPIGGAAAGSKDTDTTDLTPQRSVDSNPMPSLAHRETKVMISARINLTERAVGLHIGSSRRTTAVTDSSGRVVSASASRQQDHATADIALIGLICAVCGDEDLSKIPEKIFNIAQCILLDEKRTEFRTAFEAKQAEFRQELELLRTREQRKIYTALMREARRPSTEDKAFDTNEIEKTKLESKLALASHTANFIGDVAELMLINASKDHFVAFVRPEGARAEERGEKDAIYALDAISRMLILDSMSDRRLTVATEAMVDIAHYQHLLQDSFCEDLDEASSTLTQGLTRILRIETGAEVDAAARVSATINNFYEKLKPQLSAHATRAAGKAAELKHRAYASSMTPVEQANERKKALAEMVVRQFSNLFDFRRENREEDDGALRTLATVSARHVAIMFHAFPGLKLLPPEWRDAIYDEFLREKVLKAQGWGEYDTGRGVLGLESLKTKIREVAAIDPIQNIYSMDRSVLLTAESGREPPAAASAAALPVPDGAHSQPISDASAPMPSLAHRETKLMVSARVNITERAVELHIGSSRRTTAVTDSSGHVVSTSASKQQDHATADIALIGLICAVCEDEDLLGIPDKILNIAQCVLLDEKRAEFQVAFEARQAEFKRELELIRTREERKLYTALMREARKPSTGEKVFDSDEIEKTKLESKLALASHTANFIGDVAELMLVNASKDHFIAFVRPEGTRAAGHGEKDAIYALDAISRILVLGSGKAGEVYQQLLQNSFCEDLDERSSKLKQGLTRILGIEVGPGTNEARIQEAIRGFHDKLKPQQPNAEDASQEAGELRARFDAYNKMDETQQENERKQALAKIVVRQFGNLFDFRREGHEEDDGVLKTLATVSARHVAIMFHAFPGLKTLSPAWKQAIYDEFLQEKVLGAQGWGEYETSRGKLNLDSLKTQIKEVAVIEPNENIYSMDRSALVGRASAAIDLAPSGAAAVADGDAPSVSAAGTPVPASATSVREYSRLMPGTLTRTN